ncbi:MAG TPA: L-serine ammonia-lyase, iron-sulfur-dependent, subunit alpha [Vicinamibacterales bacterium]|nr:L-serine ammonia-lyase, iron-sulfur-dependent, subunit alpha [Vicinamibacterales bacterium]
MRSVKSLYKIGHGPSSSHTMAPRFAAEAFLRRHPAAARVTVTLYGSLAATGKGHLTDIALREALGKTAVELRWEPARTLPLHPNGMHFVASDAAGAPLGEWTVYSVGGGDLLDPEEPAADEVYEPVSMADVLAWIEQGGNSFWEYVESHEPPDIWDHLARVRDAMCASITRGLANEGTLPGVLKLPRKAPAYHIRADHASAHVRSRVLLFAYALAVAEENAAGGEIVTAPTCGSAGVLPAVLRLLSEQHGFDERKIVRALATAGLVGNLVRHNGSISGAEVGCQGEVGTACAMAAAAATQLLGGTPRQIEYAAEMGLEHHLGLTCDPVAGLVQIPCIERNAFGAARALDACYFALSSDGVHRVSFDRVVRVMRQTGHDLPSIYRETSEGGLAVV